jgi:cytochrome c
MELFNRFVLPPTLAHLELLRYLLVLAYLVHLPFIGILMGSTILSLFLNLRDKDEHEPVYALLSARLMEMAMPSRTAVVVFGVLPLPVLWAVYGQWFIHSTVNTMDFLPVGAATIVVALVLLYGYRSTVSSAGGNSIMNLGLGAAGLGALVLGSYVVFGSVTRFFDPERWFLHYHNPVRTLTSWPIIWRYLLYCSLSMAATGGAILFFFFRWPGSARTMPADHARFTKNLGAGVAIAGCILFPGFGFLYLLTLPVVTLSGPMFWIALCALGVLFVVFVYAYRAVLSPIPRFGVRSFLLLLVVFSMVIVIDQLALVNGTKEHIAGLVAEAEEREAETEMKRESLMAAAVVADPVRGEEVFKTVCMTCHRMDERLVGPPLATVLPKYAGKMDDLVAFIGKPSKVNPDYPPMPAPGLSLGDRKSVAAYLLGQIESGAGAKTQ